MTVSEMECVYCGTEHASGYHQIEYEEEYYLFCSECGESGLTNEDIIEAIGDSGSKSPFSPSSNDDGGEESTSEAEEKQQSSLYTFVDEAGEE